MLEYSWFDIVKEISPEYSLEGLMLKLKLQYFGHLMLRTDSLEKPLMLGKMEGRRRRGWQRMRWLDRLDGQEFEQAPGVSDGHGGLACCSPRGCKGSDIILCRPLLLPSIFHNIRVFCSESILLIRWSKYWSFSFSMSPSNKYSGLISFRIDSFDLLAVQGTLRVFSNTTVQKHQFFSAQLSL